MSSLLAVSAYLFFKIHVVYLSTSISVFTHGVFYRRCRFRGKITLAPVADMFNYAPNPEPRTAADGQYFLKHHKLDADGSLRITADRNQGSHCVTVNLY